MPLNFTAQYTVEVMADGKIWVITVTATSKAHAREVALEKCNISARVLSPTKEG